MEQATRNLSLYLFLVVGALLYHSGQALAKAEPTGGKSAGQSKTDAYQPVGLRAGAFFLYPVLEVGMEYDSNVFKLPSDLEKSDTILRIDPSVFAKSNWGRHSLTGYLWANLGYYDEYSEEDYTDYGVSSDVRIDVVRDSFATAYLGYSHLHEGRDSTDNRGGTEPTPYDQGVFGVGYDHTFNRLTISASYDFEALDYDNVPSILGGEIDNQDRNRKRNAGSLRLAYEVRPQFDLFVEGAVNSVNYDQRYDDTGQERSSNGYTINAGVSMDFTSILVGDVYLGYLTQDYDDPAFADITATNYGFRLVWSPTELTTVAANLGRSPQETTDPTAGGYLSTVFGIRVDHELRRNLLLNAELSYIDDKYEQAPPARNAKENENTFDVAVGAKYLLNRRFYVKGEYNYEHRESDIKADEYSAHEFMLSLGAQW